MKTPSSISTRMLSRFSITTMALALTGCPDEEEGTPGGTEGPPSACGECPANEAALCQCGGGVRGYGCFATDNDCDDWCAEFSQVFVDRDPISCYSNDPEGSCAGWNPAANVFYRTSTQTYEINQAWANALAENSAPLWTCDDAGIASIVGGFKIIGANSGEFLYQIGLRNNDKPQTINGINVKTWAGAEAAFGHFLNGQTQYTAVVQRGTNNITLKWKLVP